MRLTPLLLLAVARTSTAIYLMYLTGQHNIIPEKSLVADVTHVSLAFMRSESFNIDDALLADWTIFTSVETIRARFAEGTAVMIAVGGWGDSEGFERAAATEHGRKRFASNVNAMINATGADGVDIDWEYPGGNGEEYKRIPNSKKAWEVDAYPQLLYEIRKAIGKDKLLSAATPGLPRDMIAFSEKNMPKIAETVDFLNIMTYDLMNRRDNVTKHHTGLQASEEIIQAYLNRGLPASKANLGLAFYVKCFRTDPNGGCDVNPLGCKTSLMEDPETGNDLGQTRAFSWHDDVPTELAASFSKAVKMGEYDASGGGHFFWDSDEHLFWSWDTAEAIAKKVPHVVDKYQLGGVFAWGLGEDAPNWTHLQSLTNALRRREEKDSSAKSAPEKSEL